MQRHFALLLTFGLLIAVPAAAQPAGSIVPIAQGRVLYASLPPDKVAQRVETGTGAFAASEWVRNGFTACIPNGGKCFDITYEKSYAYQNSLITSTGDGRLHIQGEGAVEGSSQAGLGAGYALSRLTSTFTVEGVVPYTFRADVRSGPASIVLTNESGAIVERRAWQGHFSDDGLLAAGAYTLTVEAAGSEHAEFDLEFRAGGPLVKGIDCSTFVDQRSYEFGQVVRGRLWISNRGGPTPVELKMWIRLPDGSVLPARNDGADGTTVVPAGATQGHAFDVFGVGADIPPGLYELGCRLIDPATGERLDERVYLFSVR